MSEAPQQVVTVAEQLAGSKSMTMVYEVMRSEAGSEETTMAVGIQG
jgi:hypothetical protein